MAINVDVAQEAALRSGGRFRTARARRRHPLRARGQSIAAGAIGGGSHQACQGEARANSRSRPPGAGTPHHLFPELLKSMTGVEMTHVPYRGSMPALTDVAAGHVQLMFCDVPPALGLIAEGKLRALGVSTKERVGCVAESCADRRARRIRLRRSLVADGGHARRRRPTTSIERLHGEIKEFMAQREIREQIAKHGMLPIDTPSVASLQRLREIGNCAMGQACRASRRRRLPMTHMGRGSRRDDLAAALRARGEGLLRQHRRAQGRRRRGRRRRDRGADRRQRRRQIDPDDDDLRQSARARRLASPSRAATSRGCRPTRSRD